MSRRAIVEAFESRRLFTFAAFDASYGSAGVAALNTAANGFGGSISANYDGGSIVRLANYELRLQRVDAKGRTIDSFGKHGVLQLRTNARGFAVDSQSGRFAVGVLDDAGTHLSIQFYNKNARLERTVAEADLPGIAFHNTDNSDVSPTFAFDAAGRLIVVSNGIVARVLPSTGRLDTSFSGDGVVSLGIDESSSAALDGLAVGGAAGNDIAVAIRTGVDFTGFEEGTTYTRTTFRLDAAGKFVASFGTNGKASEAAGYTRRDTRTEYYRNVYHYLNGFQLLPDGSMLRLVNIGISQDFNNDEPGSETLEVSKVSAKGVFGTPTDLKASIGRKEDLTGTLAVDSEGRNAYVMVKTRIVKFDASTLALDAAFNGSDGAMNLQVNARETTLAVDRAGRLLVVGSPLYSGHYDPTSILALTGSAGGVGGAGALFTLLPHGVLDVAGTGGADSIRLRRVKGRLEVTVNGKSRRYSFDDISGIVIHSGAGDDVIRADIAGFNGGGIIIQAGKGNDRITGSIGADVVDAGDGNDTLDGHTGDDILFAGRGQNVFT